MDLRNNGGGSDGVIWPLLSVLRQEMDDGTEVVGLIGEATFSSAIINAVELQEMGIPLVGEPASGSVDHFGSTGSFTLPNTGVRVSMSTKFIDTGTLLECAAGLGVEPIQPDVTVYQTLEDYLAGQDTLVDALCARTEPFQPQERPDAPLSRGRLTELLRQAAELRPPCRVCLICSPVPGMPRASAGLSPRGWPPAPGRPCSKPPVRSPARRELPWSGRPPGSWGWPPPAPPS